MISMRHPVALDLVLPWNEDKIQEARFKRMLKRIGIPLLLLFLITPFLPLFDIPLEEEPVTKTQLILAPQKPKPKPKPKVQQPEVISEPEPAVAEKNVKPKKVKPKKKPVVKKEVAPKKAPKTKITEKKKTNPALNNLAAQFSKIHKSTNIATLQRKNVSQNTGGRVANVAKTAIGKDAIVKKRQGAAITSTAPNVSDVRLAAHKTTELDGITYANNRTSKPSSYSSNTKSQRSDESIRRIFESGKSRAYMHYQATLGKNPNLSGTLVFEVLIEPNGNISELKLVSSGLKNRALEDKILQTVRGLRFGRQEVDPRRLTYRFNFLPS